MAFLTPLKKVTKQPSAVSPVRKTSWTGGASNWTQQIARGNTMMKAPVLPQKTPEQIAQEAQAQKIKRMNEPNPAWQY